MRLSVTQQIIVSFVLGAIFMYFVLGRRGYEGFENSTESMVCKSCGADCPPVPDLTQYVLKTSIPPCQSMPDLDNYMLKSECPPIPDLSQYVLKSSVPAQQPIIIDTSEDLKAKCGECPPCPRPRCPEVKCPPPAVCPAPAPCPRAVCPQTTVKCRSEEIDTTPVRPFLAPLGVAGYGN
jgi:hypothetical protein